MVFRSSRLQVCYLIAIVLAFSVSLYTLTTADSLLSYYDTISAFFFTPPYQRFIIAPLLGIAIVELTRCYGGDLVRVRSDSRRQVSLFGKSYLASLMIVFGALVLGVSLCYISFVCIVSISHENSLSVVMSPAHDAAYIMFRLLLLVGWFLAFGYSLSVIILLKFQRFSLFVPVIMIAFILLIATLCRYDERYGVIVELLDLGVKSPLRGVLLLLITLLVFSFWYYYGFKNTFGHHTKHLSIAMYACVIFWFIYFLYNLFLVPAQYRSLAQVFWGFAEPPDLLLSCPLFIASLIVAVLWNYNNAKMMMGAIEIGCVIRGSFAATYVLKHNGSRFSQRLLAGVIVTIPFILIINDFNALSFLRLLFMVLGFSLLVSIVSSVTILAEFTHGKGMVALPILTFAIVAFSIAPFPVFNNYFLGFFPSLGLETQLYSCAVLLILALLAFSALYAVRSSRVVSFNANQEE